MLTAAVWGHYTEVGSSSQGSLALVFMLFPSSEVCCE